MYKIWCKQRNQYFADDAEFETLEDIREQLIGYHSADCDEDSLESQSLYDLVSGFEWEVHDLKGKIIDCKTVGKKECIECNKPLPEEWEGLCYECCESSGKVEGGGEK